MAIRSWLAAMSVWLIIWVPVCPAQAWWPVDGALIRVPPTDLNNYPDAMTSDSMGGTIIAFEQLQNGNFITVQRVSGTGESIWGEGISLPRYKNRVYMSRIAPDGAGGAFVVYYDQDTSPLPASARLFVRGALVLADGTVVELPLTRSGLFDPSHDAWSDWPSIISDGSGGAILAYSVPDSLSSCNVYVQGFDDIGEVRWAPEGLPVSTASHRKNVPRLVSDGAGGTIVAWDNWDAIRAQRIDASGRRLWGPTGVSLGWPPAYDSDLQLGSLDIASDGAGGAIVAWEGFTNINGGNNICVRRISASGDLLWGATAISPTTESYWGSRPAIVADGAGGAIVSWHVGVGMWLRAQRLSANGDRLWGAAGVYIVNNAQVYPYAWDTEQLVPDGAAGAILAWADDRTGQYDVYAQHLDSMGAAKWRPSGMTVCSAAGQQSYVMLSADGMGGAFAAWRDQRSGDSNRGDIYAMLLSQETLPVATLLQSTSASVVGQEILVRWTVSEAPDGIRFVVSRSEGESDRFVELPDAAIDRNGLDFSFVDARCEPGASYRYRVDIAEESGSRTLFETAAIELPALSFALHQNHPNPFNPITWIDYTLPQQCRVVLQIHDAAGRFVASLVNEVQPRGNHHVSWDGTCASGAGAASGIYFARLKAGKDFESTKMVLIR